MGFAFWFTFCTSFLMTFMLVGYRTKVRAASGGPNPGFTQFIRDEWPTAFRSVALIVGVVVFTAIVRPTGVAGFFWILAVLALYVISLLMIVEWDVTTSYGQFMDDKLWDTSGRFAPAFLAQLICIAVMAVITLITLVVWAVSSIEMPSTNGLEQPSTQTTAPTAAPTPTTSPTPAETVTSEPVETEEPSPVITPDPARTAPLAGSSKEIVVTTDCIQVNLFKGAPTEAPKLTPDIRVCIDGKWRQWEGKLPAKVMYSWSAKSGDRYYFLVEFGGKMVLIQTDEVELRKP